VVGILLQVGADSFFLFFPAFFFSLRGGSGQTRQVIWVSDNGFFLPPSLSFFSFFSSVSLFSFPLPLFSHLPARSPGQNRVQDTQKAPKPRLSLFPLALFFPLSRRRQKAKYNRHGVTSPLSLCSPGFFSFFLNPLLGVHPRHSQDEKRKRSGSGHHPPFFFLPSPSSFFPSPSLPIPIDPDTEVPQKVREPLKTARRSRYGTSFSPFPLFFPRKKSFPPLFPQSITPSDASVLELEK